MSRKKLLFIGHEYHKKTQSSKFMQDILAEKYDVEFFAFDPYQDSYDAYKKLNKRQFDIVVLWQIMPSISKLRKYVNFTRSAFFPMYDAVPDTQDSLWYEYKETQIICFCKTLYDQLFKLGFSSKYIQYFPQPLDVNNWGNANSVFFWQRITKINLETVEGLLRDASISQIHLHKAIDPQQHADDHTSKWQFTLSEWFETKEQMHAVMQQHALYIAPRRYEGIGMSFLEAMAMGRAVIAPDTPTMNEYITDGVNGFLYNPDNIKPINIDNVSQIQRNTYEYMKNGFQRWEQNKHKIIDWIEEPIIRNSWLLRIKYVPCRNFYFMGIKFWKIKTKKNKSRHYLFGLFPIFMSKR